MGKKQSVKVKRVLDCNQSLYDQLHLHNKGYFGTMQFALESERDNKNSNALAFYIESDGEVLAWSLVFKRPCYKKFSRRRSCSIYVRQDYRQQGLATKLVKSMNRYCKEAFLYPVYYSEASNEAFFNKLLDTKTITWRNLCYGWRDGVELCN